MLEGAGQSKSERAKGGAGKARVETDPMNGGQGSVNGIFDTRDS